MGKLVFKIFFVLLLLVGASNSFAQLISMQDKLYYTCKTWGFVKYYHSRVSTCSVNWDSVLISKLPQIQSASTTPDFNDALVDLLNAAGPMTLSTTYFPDTLPVELKRNKDFGWIASPVFRSDVRAILDTIKNNFRPHPSCWVVYASGYYSSPYQVTFLFQPYDSIGLNVNTGTDFPDWNHRALMLFKYWNFVRYYNPYNYVLDTPWDTTLYNNVIPFVGAADVKELYHNFLRITQKLDDAHVSGLTSSNNVNTPNGTMVPKLRLKYVHGMYLVAESLIPEISRGDAVISVDGLTMTQWEDSLRQFYAAGNESVFKRIMCTRILSRYTFGEIEHIVVKDSTGTSHNYPVTCYSPSSSFYWRPLYYADSLRNIEWTTLQCDIGYVNLSNLQISNVNKMYSDLYSKSAIVFDMRNGLGYAFANVVNLIFPNSIICTKHLIPYLPHPGTYYWSYGFRGVPGNPTPYSGLIIVLVDENTQSAAEYATMQLQALPNTITVGSQTAGADGDVSRWGPSNDIMTTISSVGIFYPNGDSTQRIGIVPDTVVYQDASKMRQHRDNVLEKALNVAGCYLGVKNEAKLSDEITVTPNPSDGKISLNFFLQYAPTSSTIVITEAVGKRVFEKQMTIYSVQHSENIDLSKEPPGLYFITINYGNHSKCLRFLKQ